MQKISIIPLISGPPETNSAFLRNESDVEQKLIYPLFVNPAYLDYKPEWIHTKQFLATANIGKGAKRRTGYAPDYIVNINGFPVAVCEAKGTDIEIGVAIEEAHLYCADINSRYPTGINPARFIIACNGIELAFGPSDSVVDVKIVSLDDLSPSSSALEQMKNVISKDILLIHAQNIDRKYSKRYFTSVSSKMGGSARLAQQLGFNPFGQELQPYLAQYFDPETVEQRDEIITRAYVSSNELTAYDSVLETYLKDRIRVAGANEVQKIVTSKSAATGITDELSRFSSNPSFFGKVQLVIGSVGAGKSTFIYRFYRHLIPAPVREKTLWSFIDFNTLPPNAEGIRDWIGEKFLNSFSRLNNIDIHSADNVEKILSVERNRFERGPASRIKESDASEYNRRLLDEMEKYYLSPSKYSECLARHFGGERGLGIVIVFDNVDRRTRAEQLMIFEAAQWFRDLTRGLVIVNLRDVTFEAHRDAPPLDAFVNAVNFYITPPRFAQVIRKRVELILSKLPIDGHKLLEVELESGFRLRYPESLVGKFLINLYRDLFMNKSVRMTAALESLVAKDVRRALGMFQDILLSPHVLATQLTGSALSSDSNLIKEWTIIRALMRSRYRYFNGRSKFIHNLIGIDPDNVRPSIFILPDALEFLVRNRKERIDFSLEGYATVETIIRHMASIGYDEGDTEEAVARLVQWGLVEPESLVLANIERDQPVRAHASGFIHMRYFLFQNEYLVGVTPDCAFADEAISELIGNIWSASAHQTDIPLSSKNRILLALADHVEAEYSRRCERHPNYEKMGHGGRQVVAAVRRARSFLEAKEPRT